MSNRRVRQAKKDVENERSLELTRIYNEAKERGGKYDSETVVEDQRQHPESPFYSEFHFDDDPMMAHQARLDLARKFIRVYKIVLPSGQKDRVVHIPPVDRSVSASGHWEAISVVVQDIDLFKRALGELETKVRAAVQAADELRMAAEQSGNADQMQMAQIAMAMSALKTASDVVKSLH